MIGLVQRSSNHLFALRYQCWSRFDWREAFPGVHRDPCLEGFSPDIASVLSRGFGAVLRADQHVHVPLAVREYHGFVLFSVVGFLDD